MILCDTHRGEDEVSKSLENRRLRWNQTSAQRVARDGDGFWIISGDVTAIPRPSRIPKVLSERN